MECVELLRDIDVAIRFQVTDANTLAQLRTLFELENVMTDCPNQVVTAIVRLTETNIGKLLGFFSNLGATTPTTWFEIGLQSFMVTGLSREDMKTLLRSPGFKSAVNFSR
jgi:hypothetical protein